MGWLEEYDSEGSIIPPSDYITFRELELRQKQKHTHTHTLNNPLQNGKVSTSKENRMARTHYMQIYAQTRS